MPALMGGIKEAAPGGMVFAAAEHIAGQTGQTLAIFKRPQLGSSIDLDIGIAATPHRPPAAP